MNYLAWTFRVTAVAALLAAVLPADAMEASLAADAHIASTTPANNYGAMPTLNIGGGSTALLKFDLSMLPAATTANKLQKANLVLFVNRVGNPGSVEVQQVYSAWAEGAVTAATQPTLGGGGSGITVPVSQANQFVTIDVTALVKSWIDNPASNNGFAIQPALQAPGTIVFLDSKENTQTAHVARLDLTLADQGPKGDTGAKGATGAMGAPGTAGAPGQKGDKGDKGNTGNTGATGATGAMGAAGPAGPVNLNYQKYDYSSPGHWLGWLQLSCPANTYVVGGGCGHRDANGASDDIVVNYAGPNPDNPLHSYACRFNNTSSDSRAIRVYAVCASATNVTGP